MTAYRYIRLGRLPAQLEGGKWTVRVDDLDAFRAVPTAAPGRKGADWATRRRQLQERLLAGDLAGSWAVLELSLARGASPLDLYVDLLGPTLRSVGMQWEEGRVSVELEHRATAVALRLVGRVSPLFVRRGRTRPGTVVVGAAPGDHHGLPVMMVADALRGVGYRVNDLGADVPRQSWLEATARGQAPLTVGVSVSTDRFVAAAGGVIRAVRRARPDALLLAGGPALGDEAAALHLGADGWAPDAAAAVAMMLEHSGRMPVTSGLS
jgi:methanogenic corrinoid protein MtbC1